MLRLVIVNYKTAGMVVDCLRSLDAERARGVELDVALVDNASPDDSVTMLRAAIERHGWAGWIRLIESGRNGGFGAGNNVGVRAIQDALRPGDWVLFLNPDTVVPAGALRAVCAAAEGRPRVGVIGARLVDEAGGTQLAGHPAMTPMRELGRASGLGLVRRAQGLDPAPKPPTQVGWVTGAAMCVRAEVLREVGEFDEGFFLYFEEVDLCRRASNAGWEVWLAENPPIVHREGAATGLNATRTRRAPYWFASRRRYFLKHHGVAGLVAADVAWAVGRGLAWGKSLARGRRAPRLPAAFGWDLLAGDLRALLTGRGRVVPGASA
ncbi:MAG: glycosyltransferase family 2 protein [Phycisphaerae bacterium]|nr:glycosyltransferase family 2 protein [Phycisphaerae bacterium]